MCLKIDKIFKTRKEAREFTKNPLIAKKNIVTYKIIYQSNYSIYRGFKYERETHYYQTGRKFSFIEYNVYPKKWRIKINKGLHSYSYKKAMQSYADTFNLYSSTTIIKTIIPKGAEYFKNNYGEYVSDQLIWH